MATIGQWVAGARPRTLPAAVAPVAVGTGVAAHTGPVKPTMALLTLFLAVMLQVGVNYANDYSDGVRGTDDERVGPVRLVGQRLAPPGAVLAAAMASFGAAAVSGLVLVAWSGVWWLLPVGAAAIAAGWFYTGGSRPYGYAGWGEVFVFVFFGLVAAAGTAVLQIGSLTALAVIAAVAPGLWASAILVANNLRDIPTDSVSGKRTLAVRLGDPRTRALYTTMVLGGFAVVLGLSLATPLALLGFAGFVPAVGTLRTVRGGAVGRELIPVLAGTGMVLLIGGLGLGLGLGLG